LPGITIAQRANFDKSYNAHMQPSLVLGIVAGSALKSDSTAKDIKETIQLLTQKRDNALRNKWYYICMNSAYFYW
jgi:hypothetical protein